jgi:protoheme IX farnesyltransferase
VTFGAFGIVYFVGAAALGGLLLGGVIRMRRQRPWTKFAWWVYKYSLLYLALLFVLMAIDRRMWS